MKGSELLIDRDTGEVHALPMAGAEEEERRLEASCVRLRLFCPNKFPGMSVGKCIYSVFRIHEILVRIRIRGSIPLIRILPFSSVIFKTSTKNSFLF
jgi:hypothetical protein